MCSAVGRLHFQAGQSWVDSGCCCPPCSSPHSGEEGKAPSRLFSWKAAILRSLWLVPEDYDQECGRTGWRNYNLCASMLCFSSACISRLFPTAVRGYLGGGFLLSVPHHIPTSGPVKASFNFFFFKLPINDTCQWLERAGLVVPMYSEAVRRQLWDFRGWPGADTLES